MTRWSMSNHGELSVITRMVKSTSEVLRLQTKTIFATTDVFAAPQIPPAGCVQVSFEASNSGTATHD